jgi:tRNA(Ile)-lysidine synthase
LNRASTLLSPQSLAFKLSQFEPYSHLYIAYSGGVDSHVLLHLCASVEKLKDKITAVYINHDLQVDAEFWGKHCEQISTGLNVNFIRLQVNAKADAGESPEEAARNARYAALKPLLVEGDALLVAQHSEDQLETVLLQLFRGSGLKGLSGMPESKPFGKGKLVRPLLGVPKTAIIEYAQTHDLKWIEDPSNQHTHFDRNFLRNDIIPLLKQRWPSLGETVPRSAQHCANAQSLIAPLADELLDAAINQADKTLNIGHLESYSSLQQHLIIRQWFECLDLKMPSQAIVDRILLEIVEANKIADPVLATQGHEFRRYRGKLYCLKPAQTNLARVDLAWFSCVSLLKISDNDYYKVITSVSGIPCEQWHNAKIRVTFRSGGETIKLPKRAGHHTLKNLYQEARVPPWERVGIPLIYLDDKLAAVGEHWISAEFYSDAKEPCYRIIRRKINPKGNDGTPDVD